jgi:hypothetical protein
MTKTQFKKKIASMKQEINQYIDKETLRLFDSGAIDTTIYEDDYTLPKIVISTALKNLSFQYFPLTSAGKKEALNLEHF